MNGSQLSPPPWPSIPTETERAIIRTARRHSRFQDLIMVILSGCLVCPHDSVVKGHMRQTTNG